MGRGFAAMPGDNAMSPAEITRPNAAATIHEVWRDNLIVIQSSKWPTSSRGRRDRMDVLAFQVLVSGIGESFRKTASQRAEGAVLKLGARSAHERHLHQKEKGTLPC
jgi:hypothetical protein